MRSDPVSFGVLTMLVPLGVATTALPTTAQTQGNCFLISATGQVHDLSALCGQTVSVPAPGASEDASNPAAVPPNANFPSQGYYPPQGHYPSPGYYPPDGSPRYERFTIIPADRRNVVEYPEASPRRTRTAPTWENFGYGPGYYDGYGDRF